MKVLIHGLLAAGLTAIMLPIFPGAAMAVEPWPEGLREAVHSYFQALQITDSRTRDLTLEDPLGLQPMIAFDRTGHKCHEVPGQVFRVYKIPATYREDQDGTFVLRSRFDLFYRQGDNIADVFSTPWERGSDGAIRVYFKKVDGEWDVVEKREILE